MKIGQSNNPFLTRSAASPRFAGYMAGPIREIVLQANLDEWKQGLKGAARQLHEIGQEEGFEVSLFAGGQLFRKTDTFDPFADSQLNPRLASPFRYAMEGSPYSIWSQDDKHFRLNPDGTETLCLAARYPTRNPAPGKLGAHLGIPTVQMNANLDGGNFFVGIDPQSRKKIAIVGHESLEKTKLFLAGDELGINLRNMKSKMRKQSDIAQRIQEAELKVITRSEEFEQTARARIAQDLGVEPANLTVIPQPAFHIDLMVRPLNNRVVLVNDFRLSKQMLDGIIQSIDTRTREGEFERETYEDLRIRMDRFEKSFKIAGYQSCDAVAETLQNAGYQVVRVPGVFPSSDWDRASSMDSYINFLNSFIHQRQPSNARAPLVMIGNESNFPRLNEAFKQAMVTLKDANGNPLGVFRDPKKDIRLVGGDLYERDYVPTNYISSTLTGMEGGIHCLGNERMQPFDRWA